MLRNEEIAWMAGLFDGEGCIHFVGVNAVRLKVKMADKDIIEMLRDRAGCDVSICIEKRSNPKHADAWYWQVQRGEDVVRLLTEMMPWFGARRKAKAEEALERLDRKRRTPRTQEEMDEEEKSLTNPCSIEGCDRRVRALGLCYKHWEQEHLRKRGTQNGESRD